MINGFEQFPKTNTAYYIASNDLNGRIDVRPILDVSDGGTLDFHIVILDWIFIGAWILALICNSLNLAINRKYYKAKIYTMLKPQVSEQVESEHNEIVETRNDEIL